MAEGLCCLNLGAIRQRMTLNKSLTAVCLESPGRCKLIMCDIHRPLWLVSVYVEIRSLSGGTLRQVGFLSRAAARNTFRKTIGLWKLSPDRVLHYKIVERRVILSFVLCRFVDRNL